MKPSEVLLCVCCFCIDTNVSVCDCAIVHRYIMSNYSVKQNLISVALLSSDNFKVERGMFVIEGLMIIQTPWESTGEAQKATEVMPFMLLA